MTEIEALEIVLARASGGASEAREAVACLTERLNGLREAEKRAKRPYTHKVVGMRFHQPYEDEFQSLDEAVAGAYWGYADNQFAPEKITDMEGVTVLDNDALHAAMGQYRVKFDEMA